MWIVAGRLIGLIAVMSIGRVGLEPSDSIAAEANSSSPTAAEARSSSPIAAEVDSRPAAIEVASSYWAPAEWVSSSFPADAEQGSELTDLPPRVGLTLTQIRNVHPHPRCLREEYPTDLVWQAYYVQGHHTGCVVAWLADTGFSARHSSISIDLYKISVKRSEPEQDNGVDWLPLGDGLFDGIFPFDFDQQAPIRLSLAVDRYGYPVIAWVNFVYHPYFTNQLRVRRWDGQAWVNMGDVLNLDPHAPASKPQLEWGERDSLIISWTEGIRHRAIWTGEEWQLQ